MWCYLLDLGGKLCCNLLYIEHNIWCILGASLCGNGSIKGMDFSVGKRLVL